MQCRVCGAKTIVLDVLEGKEKDVTTLYNLPYTAPKRTITLYRCPMCTHMQIEWMNPKEYYEDYTLISDITSNDYGMYTNQLLTYYRSLFEKLSSYAVSHNRILDIGCGAGVLMDIESDYFKETLGVEPSKVQYEIGKKQGKKIINEYFSKDLNLEPGFSAFVSTAVFEHIETIYESLEYAYSILEEGGVGLIEVPNGQKMYFEQSYYDVFSDHVNYFTPLSLCTLANRIGFEVISSSEEFNRNHISLFVRKPMHPYIKMEDAIINDKSILNDLIESYDRISIWGVGAKARSFIQLLNNKDNIKHIWDVNELLWGKYLDSTNTPITQAVKSEVDDSDIVLIFAAAYTDEIIKMLIEYGYSKDVVRFDGKIRKQNINEAD